MQTSSPHPVALSCPLGRALAGWQDQEVPSGSGMVPHEGTLPSAAASGVCLANEGIGIKCCSPICLKEKCVTRLLCLLKIRSDGEAVALTDPSHETHWQLFLLIFLGSDLTTFLLLDFHLESHILNLKACWEGC